MTGGNAETGADPIAPFLGMMSLSDDEFQDIRALIYARFGINLTDQKRSLVVGRLQKLVRSMGMNSFREYIDCLRADASGASLAELVNRISTNHTFFFREKGHFDFFTEHVLPEAVERHEAAGKRDLRIWCAGCATGEEAYTIVMLMLDFFGSRYGKWDAGLLATDISAKALGTAREGVYAEERINTVPDHIRDRYFEKADGNNWRVVERVRREVTFRRFNLMNETFPFRQPFDIIFCRNVMIYFDSPTRDALVNRLYDFTVPGGYLMIGHSESLRHDRNQYDYIMPAVYKRPEGDA